jgi:signal transduction histidine kinase
MLVYLGAVSALGSIFRGLADQAAFFLATGLVAILFEPLRRRLQRSVNRLMYGERDDPYAVLTRLSSALETTPTPRAVLPALVNHIGQALRIPYVAIRLERNGNRYLAATYGEFQDHLLSLPIVFQEEAIGNLLVAERAPGEAFSRSDRRLLETIARQAGPTAQSVRLHRELLRSRAQIVNEREEERRRIRRDLHDELGPVLASQGLKLAALRQIVRTAPEKAERMADELAQQSQETVGEIRRLVHGLRPPALDQLGLVEAVRDFVRQGESDGFKAQGLVIDVIPPAEGLPELPAAVQVNAYRIVLEALSNVARHARAGHCTVSFEVKRDGAQPTLLVVRVGDDGVGIPGQYRSGVGLHSMRERAEEIGGSFAVEPAQPSGTQITAWLPLSF